jgi:hypoxanthine phosphoribosyltransferase
MKNKLDLLISEEQIADKIAEVARLIDKDYLGKELVIVAVMKGAICLTADLIRCLDTPTSIEMIKASSYGQRGMSSGELLVSGLSELDLSSKHILLVDDIYDSGQTLSRLISQIEEKTPKTLKTLVLLSKKVKREVTYVPDYVLFSIENLFVVGFGLDYKEHYRELSGIYILKAVL